MKGIHAAVICTLAVANTGCGIRPYKEAGTKGGASWVSPGYFLEGYRDARIAEGVYLVEYQVSGGYTDPIPKSMEYALQRAAELCPGGFTHTFKAIRMEDAQIEEFRCKALGCLGWPMVSGIVTCNES